MGIACDAEIPCDDGGNKESKSDAREMIPKYVVEKEGEADEFIALVLGYLIAAGVAFVPCLFHIFNLPPRERNRKYVV